MNKAIFIAIFLLFNFLAIRSSEDKIGFRNPLKFGNNIRYKKDWVPLVEYKNIVKDLYFKETTNDNVTTIERTSSVDQDTYNKAVDNSMYVKTLWNIGGLVYFFHRHASWTFKKSHFEGQ